MQRNETILRLMNCACPSRFANYPRGFYEKLTDYQLAAMEREIVVDGPEDEDYVTELPDDNYDEVIKYTSKPIRRYNSALGIYEVKTTSGWEEEFN